MNYKLSIIIVVKNELQGFKKTLESIRINSPELIRANTEIVIIDGLSSDGTWELATKSEQITQIKTNHYQQPPQGIYPAMNLGKYKSKGEWLLYINAGDTLYDCANLIEHLQRSTKQAIQFKSGIKRPESKYAFTKATEWDQCHQALIYRKKIHEILGDYIERLTICSDVLFMSSLDKSDIEFADQILAVTQVSPKNASRNPRFLKKDFLLLSQENFNHAFLKRQWIKLALLKFESTIGTSAGVWIKCYLGQIISKYKKIDID